MAIISAENISKTFLIQGGIFRQKMGMVKALNNISFSLEEGEVLGIVGESGSGKTTLVKILSRFLEPDDGTFLWEGVPISSFSKREWAGRIQMIFQDPTASLNPKLSVYTHLKEPILMDASLSKSGNMTEEKQKERMESLLDVVGLSSDILYSYPHQFSGGQKQRLAIARALAMKPRLLVADEPVSALDLSIQAQILNLLLDLKEKFGLTIIFVSHDLAVVSHMANKIVVMKSGEIVEMGETAAILRAPKHSYTQELLSSVPAFLR